MPGTLDTLRTSTSIPDSRKKRAVVSHREHRKKLSTVGAKISKLRAEGKPRAQAVAIALEMRRRGKLRK